MASDIQDLVPPEDMTRSKCLARAYQLLYEVDTVLMGPLNQSLAQRWQLHMKLKLAEVYAVLSRA
jgi:hypothetical protein